MQEDLWNKFGKVHIRRVISEYNLKKQQAQWSFFTLGKSAQELSDLSNSFSHLPRIPRQGSWNHVDGEEPKIYSARIVSDAFGWIC